MSCCSELANVYEYLHRRLFYEFASIPVLNSECIDRCTCRMPLIVTRLDLDMIRKVEHKPYFGVSPLGIILFYGQSLKQPV